ncbi:MAG: DUF1638 domain-containing protein [Granulosicoccus sp.]
MTSRKSTLVIACGAIAHELVAVQKLNQLTHIEIQCLPAHWHNTPERIAPGVEEKIKLAGNAYARILVAYGDCGTGGLLDKVLENYSVERLPGDHCYSFFAGSSVFETMATDELGTFYLTDYLVDNFDRLIADGLGISAHPELIDQYFSHYTRVMYLVQDQQAKQSRLNKAQSAAAVLGLPLEVYETGLQPFANSLRTIQIASV